MYESYYWLYLELWINFVSASIKGQPLYKGQKARSQCVRYSEVSLYMNGIQCIISMDHSVDCRARMVLNTYPECWDIG